MVHAVEEFPYVALEHEARTRSVPARPTDHFFERGNAFMSPIPHTTRERRRNKRRLKNGIDYGKYGVMQNAIAHRRFVDMSLFWIANIETGIGAMSVRVIGQLAMQLKNILFETPLEFLNINFISLVGAKRVPCGKQALRRDDLVE